MQNTLQTARGISAKNAMRFVVLIGVVSLFADMTYEGARAINGPFLAILGASGAVVGLVSGLGELIGFSIRLVSGYFSDKTKSYWAITFFGYAVNLIAVPLLALAGNWQIAAALMVIERIGKGIRVPPRDAMLSYATHQMGRGWGFGLHEALDQLGAITGPLIVAAVLYLRDGYKTGYALLLAPALLALGVLTTARFLYPRPQDLEISRTKLKFQGFSKMFWLYVLAAAFIAAGFADFPLIAYHFQKASVASETMIPILYAVAMGVDAIAALAFGRLFDRFGLTTMMLVAFLSAFFAPLVFFGNFPLAMLGMAFWGIGMGAQESIMRAAIGGMIAPEQRGTAYGLFNMVYGFAWFLGSLLIGVLYDVSILWLVAFSVAAQLISIPIFYSLRKLS
ncbi:MAG: MFS transporter [Chloroflexota bacterium]|nr:MFS transporter [Chloroflexota bacterium]MBI5705283.1 MFS transporter [Chloroflexota bacterium]